MKRPPTAHNLRVILCEVDGARYGLPEERVIEVAQRVRIVPLAGAPEKVLGIVVYRGQPVVVVDARATLGHPRRAPRMSDAMVFARGRQRTIALVIDEVLGDVEIDPTRAHAAPFETPHVQGIVVLEDGLVLIEDLDAVLSLEEEERVERALHGPQ